MSSSETSSDKVDKYGTGRQPEIIHKQLVNAAKQNKQHSTGDIIAITNGGNQVGTTKAFNNMKKNCDMLRDKHQTAKANEILYVQDIEASIKKGFAEISDEQDDSTVDSFESDFNATTKTTDNNNNSQRIIDFLRNELHYDNKRKMNPRCKHQGLVNKYKDITYDIYDISQVKAMNDLITHYNHEIYTIAMLAVDESNALHTSAVEKSNGDGCKLLRLLRMTTEQSQLSSIAREQKGIFDLIKTTPETGTSFAARVINQQRKVKTAIDQYNSANDTVLSATEMSAGLAVHQLRMQLSKQQKYQNAIIKHQEINMFEKDAMQTLIAEIQTIDQICEDGNESNSNTTSTSMVASQGGNNNDDFPDKDALSKIHDGKGPGILWYNVKKSCNFDDDMSKYYDYKDYCRILNDGILSPAITTKAVAWAKERHLFDKHNKKYDGDRGNRGGRGNSDRGRGRNRDDRGDRGKKGGRGGRGGRGDRDDRDKKGRNNNNGQNEVMRALTAQITKFTKNQARDTRKKNKSRAKRGRRDKSDSSDSSRSRSRSRSHERDSEQDTSKSMFSFPPQVSEQSSSDESSHDDSSSGKHKRRRKNKNKRR